jgi:hypothetical protein
VPETFTEEEAFDETFSIWFSKTIGISIDSTVLSLSRDTILVQAIVNPSLFVQGITLDISAYFKWCM